MSEILKLYQKAYRINTPDHQSFIDLKIAIASHRKKRKRGRLEFQGVKMPLLEGWYMIVVYERDVISREISREEMTERWKKSGQTQGS